MHSKLSISYKENVIRGTGDFPCSCYYSGPATHSPEAPFEVRHHWHDEVEILYFEYGRFEVEINMKKFPITEESFVFAGSGDLHAIHGEPGFSESAVVFSPALLSFSSADTCQMTFIQPLQTKTLCMPQVVTASTPCFEEIKNAYLSMLPCFIAPLLSHGDCLESTPSLPWQQLRIKASLLTILSSLAQADLLFSQQPRQDPKIDMIKQTISYMKEHYREHIYIRDLAALVNINEQYFCRYFRQIIGRPPIEYLNELRIRQAMHLLTTTNASVMDISLECGFNNLGNFMRTFKKKTHTTPLQYRKSAPVQPQKVNIS